MRVGATKRAVPEPEACTTEPLPEEQATGSEGTTKELLQEGAVLDPDPEGAETEVLTEGALPDLEVKASLITRRTTNGGAPTAAALDPDGVVTLMLTEGAPPEGPPDGGAPTVTDIVSPNGVAPRAAALDPDPEGVETLLLTEGALPEEPPDGGALAATDGVSP